MTEMSEWDALVSEALTIRETAEEKNRRLLQLQRDILTAELTEDERTGLLRRVYAAVRVEATSDRC